MEDSTTQIHPTVEMSCASIADRVVQVQGLFERAMGLSPRIVCLQSMAYQMGLFQAWAARMGVSGVDASRRVLCWEQWLQDNQQTATLRDVHHHLDAIDRALQNQGLRDGALLEHCLSLGLAKEPRRRRRTTAAPPLPKLEDGEREAAAAAMLAAGRENGPDRGLRHENNKLIEWEIQPAVHGL